MIAPRDISVTVPFGQALERVRVILFQPFDLAKWFVMGFCAWLAYLGQGGFHGGYNFGPGPRGRNGLRAEFEHAREYVVSNLGWILPLAIILTLVIICLWLVVLWLSSRGRFMFLHCVALNTAEVAVPWRQFAQEAHSLFVFRVLLALMSVLAMVPLIAGLLIVLLRMALRETVTVGGLAGAIGLFLALLVLSIFLWVIGRLLNDFVVPVQFLRGRGCMAGWREVAALVRSDPAHFLLYLLFRIALAIGIAVAVLIVVVATCCCAGCLFALPYLGTVLLLPAFVLERSYSLYYLAQYGPAYTVFPTPVRPQ